MSWFWQVLTGQVRQRLAYPWGFWSALLLELFVIGSINWFLWSAMIEARQGQAFPGFTLRTLVLYALITTVLRKTQVNADQWGGVSEDIYSGSLNKYLVYPVSYLAYRFALHLGSTLVSLLQSSLALFGFWLWFARQDISLPGLAELGQFFILVLLASSLRFLINCCLQSLAFWFDQVWSLMVLMGFLVMILGGQLLPLSLYPRWAQELLALTPFPLLAAWPAEALLGRVSWQDFSMYLLVSSVWLAIIFGIYQLVFQRGLRNYSGIGA